MFLCNKASAQNTKAKNTIKNIIKNLKIYKKINLNKIKNLIDYIKGPVIVFLNKIRINLKNKRKIKNKCKA